MQFINVICIQIYTDMATKSCLFRSVLLYIYIFIYKQVFLVLKTRGRP